MQTDTKKITRLDPYERRELILDAAVKLAKGIGYQMLTKDKIAIEANISGGLLHRYFNSMFKLKREVMRYAIKHEIIDIIAQGIAARDSQALAAPDELKRKAVEHLTKY